MYSFASLVGGAYGPIPENPNAVQFVNLKDCDRDLKALLKSCNIPTDIESIDSERKLLLARAGESTGTVIFPVIQRRFTCKSYKLLTLFLRHFHHTTMSATGDSLSQTQVGVPGEGGGGGGGGALNKVLYGEAPPRSPNPYLLYAIFDSKGTPFVHLS